MTKLKWHKSWTLQDTHLCQGHIGRHGHEHCVAAVVYGLGHWEAVLVQGLHEGVLLERCQARQVQPAARTCMAQAQGSRAGTGQAGWQCVST